MENKKKMSNQQKARALFDDILKSKDVANISDLRQELDFYLDEIERQKLDRQLKKEYEEQRKQGTFYAGGVASVSVW